MGDQSRGTCFYRWEKPSKHGKANAVNKRGKPTRKLDTAWVQPGTRRVYDSLFLAVHKDNFPLVFTHRAWIENLVHGRSDSSFRGFTVPEVVQEAYMTEGMMRPIIFREIEARGKYFRKALINSLLNLCRGTRAQSLDALLEEFPELSDEVLVDRNSHGGRLQEEFFGEVVELIRKSFPEPKSSLFARIFQLRVETGDSWARIYKNNFPTVSFSMFCRYRRSIEAFILELAHNECVTPHKSPPKASHIPCDPVLGLVPGLA